MLRQNQPIRSSEEEAEELKKHGYVVVVVGLDATRRRVMKLNKVVFHYGFISPVFRIQYGIDRIGNSKIPDPAKKN